MLWWNEKIFQLAIKIRDYSSNTKKKLPPKTIYNNKTTLELFFFGWNKQKRKKNFLTFASSFIYISIVKQNYILFGRIQCYKCLSLCACKRKYINIFLSDILQEFSRYFQSFVYHHHHRGIVLFTLNNKKLA